MLEYFPAGFRAAESADFVPDRPRGLAEAQDRPGPERLVQKGAPSEGCAGAQRTGSESAGQSKAVLEHYGIGAAAHWLAALRRWPRPTPSRSWPAGEGPVSLRAWGPGSPSRLRCPSRSPDCPPGQRLPPRLLIPEFPSTADLRVPHPHGAPLQVSLPPSTVPRVLHPRRSRALVTPLIPRSTVPAELIPPEPWVARSPRSLSLPTPVVSAFLFLACRTTFPVQAPWGKRSFYPQVPLTGEPLALPSIPHHRTPRASGDPFDPAADAVPTAEGDCPIVRVLG